MKRTLNKTPNAILTGDWHLREDQPTCRTDDFWKTQWKKVDFIKHLQEKYNCPVLHAGDLFNHWKPSPRLLSETILRLPKHFYTIYGNHDLPQHNLDLAYKCGINTLERAGVLAVLDECHWNQEPKYGSFHKEKIDVTCISDSFPRYIHYGSNILVWHVMNYQGKKPWPGCIDPSAASLLRKQPQYDLILTGHNHKPFVEKHEGRLLVNPGSITRQATDQIDHKPRVYLWYAKTNTVEPIYLPIEQDVISREHIDKISEREDRIDAFISKLDNDWEAGVSFEENLERFEKTNQVRQSVIQIVHKAVEQ